jgi:hypothetical protein
MTGLQRATVRRPSRPLRTGPSSAAAHRIWTTRSNAFLVRQLRLQDRTGCARLIPTQFLMSKAASSTRGNSRVPTFTREHCTLRGQIQQHSTPQASLAIAGGDTPTQAAVSASDGGPSGTQLPDLVRPLAAGQFMPLQAAGVQHLLCGNRCRDRHRWHRTTRPPRAARRVQDEHI